MSVKRKNHFFGSMKSDEDQMNDVDDTDDKDAFEEMLNTDEAEWYDITNMY